MSTRAIEARREPFEIPWLALFGLFGALVLGAASVVSPTRAVVLVGGLLFVGIALWSLAAGVAVFTFVIFFGQLPGIANSGVSLVKLAGFVLVASWLLRLASRAGGVPLLVREHPALASGLAAFFGWAFLSSLWAADGGTALSTALRLGQGILLVFVVFSALRERRDLRAVLWAYVAGALVTALVGLVRGVSPEAYQGYGNVSRLSGALGDPNYFAAVIVPALAFSVFLFSAHREPVVRWLLLGCVGLFAVALFLTGSRGGIVALGATFIAVVLFAGPVRARALAVALVTAGVGVAYLTLFAPPAAITRITDFSAGGGSGRSDLWSIATEIVGNHPAAGIGAGNFVIVEPRYVLDNASVTNLDQIIDTPHVTHNTYLDVLTELGAIGLAIFLFVLAATLGICGRAIKLAARVRDGDLEILSRGVLIAALGLLAGYVFLTAEYEKQLWLVLAIAASGLSLVRHASPAETEPEAVPAVGAPGRRDYHRPVRDDKIERRERRVALRTAAIRLERQRIDRKEAELERLEAELAQREEALAAQSQDVGDLEHSLVSTQADVRRIEETVTRRLDAIAERETELAAYAEELRAWAKRLEGERMRLVELRRETEEFSERFAERDTALAEGGRELARAAAKLEARERALARAESPVEVSRPQPVVVALPPAPVPEPAPVAAEPEPAPVEPAVHEPGIWTIAELDQLVAAHGAEFPDRVEEWSYYLVYLRGHAEVSGVLPESFAGLVFEVFEPLIQRARRQA